MPDLGERLLVDLGLRVDAVEHRDLRSRGAGSDEPLDGLGDRGGLGDLVGMLAERRHRPGIALADQVKPAARHPAAGVGDHPIRQRHHLGRGPVVAFQADHRRLGEPPREVQQIARGGPGERVDGLVRVADDGQVVAVAEPRVEHALLQRRDVLVLVDDETPVAVPELLRDGGVVLDGGRRVQQQIVEVQQRGAVAASLHRLVPGVHGGDPGGIERDVATDLGDRIRIGLGADQGRLRPLDLAREIAHVVGAGLHRGAVGGLGHHAELAVEQLPAGVTDQPGPEVLQLSAGGGVKRHGLHPAGARPRPGFQVERAQPGAHLPRGARRERHGQHLAGGHVTGGHQVRDAPGDGAGLAGTGAGQHAHRPTGRLHGLALLVVEVVQEGGDRSLERHGVHLGRALRQLPTRPGGMSGMDAGSTMLNDL